MAMAVNRESTLYINDAFLPFINDTHRYSILWGGAGCFDGETLINTTNGYKPISHVNVGDMVLSFNENLLIPEYKEVVDKFCYKTSDIKQNIITFVFDNKLIKCTNGHKFYLRGSWITAEKLAIRAMENSINGERFIFHKRQREVINYVSLWTQEDFINETSNKQRRVFVYNDYNKGREIQNNKNSQTCCGRIFGKSNESTRSKSQRWHKNKQLCYKFRVVYPSTKYETRFCKQSPIKFWFKSFSAYINRKRCNLFAKHIKTYYKKNEDRFSEKIWRNNIYNKSCNISSECYLEASEIDITKVREIYVSNENQIVYDLQVKDNQNYCITTDNIIVHNSGKSVSAAQKVVMRCLSEIGTKDAPFQHRIAVIRKYKTSIKQSVYNQVKQICIAMNLEQLGLVRFNESYMEIKFANGAEIFFSGLDDPEKIKSLVATSAWIEEATELEQADFEQLDLRLRGMAQYYKQIIITFNPIDETHWIKSKFFDNIDDGLVFTMHSTYKDNQFIDEQYKRVLEERFKYDENQFRIYVKGSWGRIKTGSEYYFNFRYEKHVVSTVKYISGLPLHISFDFNVNPYISATISQIYGRPVDGGKRTHYFVNVIDEFALTNPYNTTERLCEHIITKYKEELKYGCFIYGDATGKHKTTRGNISDYDVIEYAFARYMTNSSMRVPKANPMIKKRRNFINKLLYGGFPNIQLQISPKCVKLINDFQVAIEEQDGSKKKQMGKDPLSHVVYEKNGHHADCNDYFLCAVFENYFESI